MQTKKFFAFGLLLSATLFVFNACTKQENETIAVSAAQSIEDLKVENGRLVFKDTKQYFYTLEKLASKNINEIKEWEKSIGFQSLRTYSLQPGDYVSKNLDSDLPLSNMCILNPAREVVIGNEILWYNDGKIYYINTQNADNLSSLKQNPASATKTTEYGYLSTNNPQKQGLVWVNDNNSTPTIGRDFFESTPMAGYRRYLHRIRVFHEIVNNSFVSKAFLITILEWKSSKKGTWKPSSEVRELNYNLSGDMTVYLDNGTTYNVDLTRVVSTPILVQNTSEILIGLGSPTGVVPTPVSGWSGWCTVNLNGTISHKVLGDSESNRWNHTGYPLW